MYEANVFKGDNKGKHIQPHMAMTAFRTQMWKHVQQEMSIAQALSSLGQVAMQSAILKRSWPCQLGRRSICFTSTNRRSNGVHGQDANRGYWKRSKSSRSVSWIVSAGHFG